MTVFASTFSNNSLSELHVSCTFHGYPLDCSIPVEYAWLLESIYIRHRVVDYHLLVDICE